MTQNDKKGFTPISIAAREIRHEITFNAGGSITFSTDLTAYFVQQNNGSGAGLGVNISTKDGTDSKGKKKGKVILFEVVPMGDGVQLALKINKQNNRLQLNAKGFYKNIGVPVLGKRWGHKAIELKGSGVILDLNKRATSTKKKTASTPADEDNEDK